MKERIDVLATNQGLFDTREQAKRGVMAGLVVDSKSGERYDKPGQKIDDGTELRLKGERLRYVSRGGLKLEKALKEFDLEIQGKICLDIGSSTGGFTDVMLQNGAKLVYALDVGTNQLAWKIRSDERVIVMEQFNFRNAVLADFEQGRPSFTSIDVSFISLDLILPPLYEILEEDGEVAALIKPQFEAGREQVGKNGIIRDPKVHQTTIEKVLKTATQLGFSVKGLTFSPIKGGAGNVEFLVHLLKDGKAEIAQQINIESVLQKESEEL
ncbi:TlyA family RNA methyltransferase [Lactococcus lactis]|uniref:TlyA family RNA methyltransferase n=1 Tax=Lactococcus lactis TaxID=1358 RepID=UPI00223C1124|nr:TlyA family RNA methyltransferase [Lactococcus lactis]MCT1194610.1 TlyA family RNA methyltransferase [Lactococcus lactis]